MSLDDYQITYSGYPWGDNPTPKTFRELGVTAAKVVVQAGGVDYAEITVDLSVTDLTTPFLPYARHDLRTPGGDLVFSGWLMQPAKRAKANKHQQTFRLEGPLSRLQNIIYRQPWTFAIDPSNVSSTTEQKGLAQVIFNKEDFITMLPLSVKLQLKQILDFGIAHGAPVSYVPTGTAHGLDTIPAANPPEDEQADVNVADAVKRQLRWTPKVCTWWQYASGTPTLAFSAADPATPETITTAAPSGSFPKGMPYLLLPDGDSVLIDVISGRINDFRSNARYDQMIGVFKTDFITELMADSGESTRLWMVLSSDVSPVGGVATNGSPREFSCTVQLRGASTALAEDGHPLVQAEPTPTGLAATLHAPYAVLTYDVDWTVTYEDVEWETRPGMAVSVLNGGAAHPITTRSILQSITRDLGTGTVAYQAGLSTQLGLADLLALLRINATRNQGRGGTGSGGYNQGGGPVSQNYGFKDPNQGSSGSSGSNGNGSGGTSPPGSCLFNHSANVSSANEFAWPCTAPGSSKSVRIGAGGEPTITLTDLGGLSLELNLGVLAGLSAPNGTNITLRQLDACNDGVLGTRFVLCSDFIPSDPAS